MADPRLRGMNPRDPQTRQMFFAMSADPSAFRNEFASYNANSGMKPPEAEMLSKKYKSPGLSVDDSAFYDEMLKYMLLNALRSPNGKIKSVAEIDPELVGTGFTGSGATYGESKL